MRELVVLRFSESDKAFILESLSNGLESLIDVGFYTDIDSNSEVTSVFSAHSKLSSRAIEFTDSEVRAIYDSVSIAIDGLKDIVIHEKNRTIFMSGNLFKNQPRRPEESILDYIKASAAKVGLLFHDSL